MVTSMMVVKADAGSPVLPAIVPRPASLQLAPGSFVLSKSTRIVVGTDDPEVRTIAAYLADRCARETGLHVPVVGAAKHLADPSITLALDPRLADTLGPEGYQLDVSPTRVLLHAARPAGLFHGVQTLRQLVEQATPAVNQPRSTTGRLSDALTIPALRINDKPRYRWRGMLLDCGRHFMDKQFVKRYIDLLAYHKMNVLHWHLTEDQGWRIEIKKYPKLTEIGAWRKATRDNEQPRKGDLYGGYYTQDDIREIVAYAASRYITVVPEIEMPGHCVAALAAYPELSCTGGPFQVRTRWGIAADVYCAGNDQTFEFLQNVLTEVMDLFPAAYIHIGGDECLKRRWKKCPKCQARIKAEGLKDENELQSYFIRRIEKFLNAHNRRLIGWDEILEGGLAPNATVQSWRGMRGALAAATAGHDVISSPTSHCYLDYAQYRAPGEPTNMGYLTLERCYSFEPTPAQLAPEQARHVLGLEGNMWTEHAAQNRIDWQVFPRLCALCEVGWTPKRQRNYEDFARRMRTHYRRLDQMGVHYFVAPANCVSRETTFTESADVVLDNPLGFGTVRVTLDGSDPTPDSPAYRGPIHLTHSATVKTRTWLPSGHTSPVAVYEFRKLRPLEPVQAPDARPGLHYELYHGRWRLLPDFDTLTPLATGVTPKIDLSMRKRDNDFALRLRGLIEVPADGTYTFYLTSDDGSVLKLHGETVVNNDGLHAPTTREGQVILKAGKHPIEVTFFQVGGARRLRLGYAGPGIEPTEVPAKAYTHQP